MTGAPQADGLSSQATEPKVSALRASIPSAFTPGPWEVREDGEVAGTAGPLIANVAQADDFPCIQHEDCADQLAKARRECPANAHLIAAAPEMFAALDELRDFCGKLIRQADFRDDWPNGTAVLEKLLPRASAALAKARGEQ